MLGGSYIIKNSLSDQFDDNTRKGTPVTIELFGMHCPVLDPSTIEFLLMIINNIVPTSERLYMKMHIVDSPNCVLSNVREDFTHIFTECISVREAWGWARQRILSLLPDSGSETSNFEFLYFMFLKHVMLMIYSP